MKAIIGLGNPEVKYKMTRHNVGFMVLDKILSKKNLTLKDKFKSFFASDGEFLYLLPKTYMNLSGEAIQELVSFYKLTPKDILVVFDDVTLPLGALRFREKGSDGGHNGIKSIIKCLNSSDFPRLKVGVGPLPDTIPLDRYVLQNFDDTEKLNKVLELAVDAVDDYFKLEFIQIQNKYNKVHF